MSNLKPKRARAVGIVIDNDNILLMRRKHDNRVYYTFPGGGVEEGETVEDAVLRELKEETSIDVKILKLLYQHDLTNDSDHYFYLCDYIGGELKLGGQEYLETLRGDIHEPIWFRVDALLSLTLYPLEVRDWILEDYETNFSSAVRILKVSPDQLRQ